MPPLNNQRNGTKSTTSGASNGKLRRLSRQPTIAAAAARFASPPRELPTKDPAIFSLRCTPGEGSLDYSLHAEIVEVEIELVSPSIVPSGNFAELNRTVTCMVLKANDRRTSCPCHDEFRGPRSD
ncbi:hypothetical protein TNCV_4520181 [Trichonephila clavipes]|nr:hypothetical protein TNCV_4520181 [Trichonephila clavipes]